MPHQHLFRHPVGFFPARARWYLAGISMLALLLVAAHFALQVHTQDVARTTVNQWLRRSGGSVDKVRFHLLRNALTLDGVHLQSGKLTISIPEVLLYGHVDSLLGGHPALSRVTLTSPRLQLPAASALRLLASQAVAGDTMFEQIWRLARHLEIRGGSLELFAGKGGSRHWTFDGLNLLIRDQPGGRMIQGSFRYRGSPLAVQSRMRPGTGGAAGSITVSWDRLDGRAVGRELMGLAPLNGELSGQAQWQWQADAAGQVTRSQLQGEMRVVTNALVVDDTSVVPSLQWQADQANDRWQAHVSAKSWSLMPLLGLAPVWYGHRLVSGRFSGDVDAAWTAADPSAGSFRIAKGVIRGLDYVPVTWPGDAQDRPDWHIDRIDVADAVVDPHRSAFVIGKLKMAGGEIRLAPGQAPAPVSPDSWALEVKQARISHVAAVLVFADGRPVLRTLPLSGQARIAGGSFQCNLAAADAPVTWNIRGQGHWPWPAAAAVKLNVDAAGLPLIQMRALLPFAEGTRTGSAVELAGQAGFSLAVDISGDQWTASGNMDARNVAVSWQGNSWHAAQVKADLDRIGTGMPAQALRSLQASGWQYQGALQSLTSAPDAAAGGSDSLLPLRSGSHWRIDTMAWQGGTVSFGRADAIWGRNVDMQMSGWAEGRMAPLKLSGNIGGGAFQVVGTLGRIDGYLHANLKGGVTNARPFFLNDWLQVSGAPRVIRGDWSSQFTWKDDDHGLGHGHLRLWLRRWQLESGAFPNDPFLARAGFGAHDLLRRLGAGRLAVLDADYVQAAPGSFAWSDLGDALLAVIRNKAESAAAPSGTSPSAPRMETRIRLHGKVGLSYNERLRLYRVRRFLAAHKKLVADLLPQLGTQALNADIVATIRHTQDMIEQYMIERGIARRRLFPVWPTSANGGQGSLGIRVEVRQP
jgi:hypothetical protein